MKIRCMTTDDLTRAAAFTAAEGWSSETLTTFESFHANDPQGCFIAEEHGRCTGICVATGYRRSGFVGELIIAPGRRNRGNGRRLLQHAIDYLRGRGREEIHLDGVARAVPLYERMGFARVCRSLRYAGRLGTADTPGVRPMTASDLPAVRKLDAEAFGDDRAFFIEWFLERSPELCLVLDQGAGPDAFILGRYGDGSLAAGPWVVRPGTERPERLLRALAAAGNGRSIGLGVLESNTAAVAAVERLGLRRHPDPPWRMVLGSSQNRLGGSASSWAVGSAAKG